MVFAVLNPRQTAAGTPFENVAQEVLNGLFCHYEPPVSEYAQAKAAQEARTHPKKYSFSQVKKSQSILRTSKLYRKKHAVREQSAIAEEPVLRKKKAVTWRDEQNRAGIEGRMGSCAATNCGFLGFGSDDSGLADRLSPTAAASGPLKEARTPPAFKSGTLIKLDYRKGIELERHSYLQDYRYRLLLTGR